MGVFDEVCAHPLGEGEIRFEKNIPPLIQMKPMKKILSLLIAQSLFVSADTLYVDNDTSHPADFRTLVAAHDAASDGDVIILAPSSNSYDGLVVTKKITIKGNGFGGDAPPNLLGSPVVATVAGLITLGGTADENEYLSAQGAVLESLRITNGVNVNSSSCFLKRCWINRLSVVLGPGLTIEGCLFDGSVALVGSSTQLGDGSGTIFSTSLNVRNTIFLSSVSMSHTASFDYCILRGLSGRPVPGHSLSHTVVRNSIFGQYQGQVAFQPSNTLNSLFIDSSAIFGNSVACFTGTYEDTFTGEGDWGASFQIKAGAAALTASTEGGEIGIFGGPTPFKVGGYPPIPRILKADMISANPTTGLTFKVEAEARD